ncbi:hypothetical protein M011DRAFT_455021 [Sporormia fimetaria CBS 119925]|uniref:Heterokaryon incompatibility domain-containing protein n=1 Tax=Sporormia fimetaria CBS 119925 TaxID=1340428 RepID=A0A6A6VQV7_9PLEO|nr:hypothetical protein M011DRAFT_455021 [Sporormia fimetaria CBS 119925]
MPECPQGFPAFGCSSIQLRNLSSHQRVFFLMELHVKECSDIDQKCVFVPKGRHFRGLARAKTTPALSVVYDVWPHNSDEEPSASHASPPQYHGLCRRCQKFDIQTFTQSPNLCRGYLLRDVRESAENGCEFCTLLLDCVKDVPVPEYFYDNGFGKRKTRHPDIYVHMTLSRDHLPAKTKSERKEMGLGVNRLLLELGDRYDDVDVRNASPYELCVAADRQSPAALSGDVVGRYIGNDPASDESFLTASAWIAGCTGHRKCNETVSGVQLDAHNAPLPTRCIEITPNTRRLCLRETQGQRGAYLTLTHRWNTATAECKTTTENYAKRLQGEGLDNLPPLFRDALGLAERFGIKYDGDGGEDWGKEATKMAQYYQYSVFTIAGTAEDMRNGILKPRHRDHSPRPWASRLARLPYRDRNHVLAGSFYVFARKTPLVQDYVSQIRESILFRRGWILQEWLLSKRLLWYTPSGLFFECQEELPLADDESQITLNAAGPALEAHLRIKSSFHYTNEDILGFWYRALEVYSTCYLTRPDLDRIKAVSGLAKEVGAVLERDNNGERGIAASPNNTFMAGLWLMDLHHGLLWEQNHSASAEPFPKLDVAPTWSWASILAPFKWPVKDRTMKPSLSIEGVCLCERKSHEDPEFRLADGAIIPRETESQLFDPANLFSCIHVGGKVHTVHIRGYLSTEENLYNAAVSTAYSPVPSSAPWRAICAAPRPEVIAGWGSLERLDTAPGVCDDYGIAVLALEVSSRHVRSGFLLKRSDPVMDVLFLEELPDREGVFRRLGVGRIADQDLIREFEAATEENLQLV